MVRSQVTVDPVGCTTTIESGKGSKNLKGHKWITFFALLEEAQEINGVLVLDQLVEHTGWSHLRSPGPSISNQLKDWRCLFSSDSKITNVWQLADTVSVMWDTLDAREWIARIRPKPQVENWPLFLEWLKFTIRSIIHFNRGRFAESLTLARRSKTLENVPVNFRAIAELTERFIVVTQDDCEVEVESSFVDEATFPFREAIQRRRELIEIFAARRHETSRVITELTSATAFADSGLRLNWPGADISMAHNVLGTCHLQVGNLKQAMEGFSQSILWGLIPQDLQRIHAGLCNLASAILQRAKQDSDETQRDLLLRTALGLVELDRELARAHRLGLPSIEPELLLARISLRLDQIDQAGKWLLEAEARIASACPEDLAWIKIMKAWLGWFQSNESTLKILGWYQAGVEALAQIDPKSEATFESETEAVRREEPPAIGLLRGLSPASR